MQQGKYENGRVMVEVVSGLGSGEGVHTYRRAAVFPPESPLLLPTACPHNISPQYPTNMREGGKAEEEGGEGVREQECKKSV